MILRNWINKIVGADDNSYNKVIVKNTYGNSQNTDFMFNPSENIYADNYNEISLPAENTLGIGLVIGSGTTTPTINDYKMENAITTNLNAGGVTRSFNANNSNSSLTVVQPIVNLGASTITISEIGLFAKYNAASNTGCLLLSRDIISPVTIAPNESKTFVVTIDFTQMSTNASAS
jgi:hypothetical protein